jgi:hypothetical protein
MQWPHQSAATRAKRCFNWLGNFLRSPLLCAKASISVSTEPGQSEAPIFTVGEFSPSARNGQPLTIPS